MKALSGNLEAMFAAPAQRRDLLNQVVRAPAEKTLGLCLEMLKSKDQDLVIVAARQLSTAERPDDIATAISALLERSELELQVLELEIMLALSQFVIRNRTEGRLPVIGKFFLSKFCGSPAFDVVSSNAISHFVFVCQRQTSCARMLNDKLDLNRSGEHVVNCALQTIEVIAANSAQPIEPLVPAIARLHEVTGYLHLRAAEVLSKIKSESALRALEQFSA